MGESEPVAYIYGTYKVFDVPSRLFLLYYSCKVLNEIV